MKIAVVFTERKFHATYSCSLLCSLIRKSSTSTLSHNIIAPSSFIFTLFLDAESQISKTAERHTVVNVSALNPYCWLVDHDPLSTFLYGHIYTDTIFVHFSICPGYATTLWSKWLFSQQRRLICLALHKSSPTNLLISVKLETRWTS